MRTIARDPFARESTVRRTMVTADHLSCNWCGQHRPGNRVYQYGTERDDRSGISFDRATGGREAYFCSKSCRTSYYS